VKSFIFHLIAISLLLLISAIMNSYTLTVLSREIMEKKRELRRVSWIEDSLKFLRFYEAYR
jgi:cell division protein FtsL